MPEVSNCRNKRVAWYLCIIYPLSLYNLAHTLCPWKPHQLYTCQFTITDDTSIWVIYTRSTSELSVML